jgi:H+/gluconate symporter-like permease
MASTPTERPADGTTEGDESMAEMAIPASVAAAETRAPANPTEPSFAVAITPVVAVIALNYVFAEWLIPALDTRFLAQPRYGAVGIGAVAGLWSTVMAVAVACMVVVALNRGRFADLLGTVNQGTLGSMLPMLNVASEVGYGSVVASLPAFAAIRGALTAVASDPVWSVFITVNVLAGITGSASGGLSIALASLGDFFVEQARAAGVSMEIMHRAAAIASGGMDLLPHNGAVITLLAICGLTHRQSYLDILAVSVIATLAGVVMILVQHATGTF